MIEAFYITDFVLVLVFCLCYAFQFAYLLVPFIKKLPPHKSASEHKFAVLICARDEEDVIADLISAIDGQDYPGELITTVVIADNCKDGTAALARSLGSVVYERFSDKEIGKGYAIDHGLSMLDADYGEGYFDAYIVFDADNVPEPDFISEINKSFSDGYDVITSYRNTKNFGDSWLSGGAGIWFLRESKYLNGSRFRIGACPQVSGTGFLFSERIKKELGGWPFHTLTEDYEFTCHSVVSGKRFGYCEEARFYDEQTSTFRASWNQRLRWCRGGLQSFAKYKGGLAKGLFSKRFLSCYDMIMSLAPAYALSIIACVVNAVFIAVLLISGRGVGETLIAPAILALAAYLLAFVQGAATVATEWKRISARPIKKILYTFTFPIYLMTFVPIAAVALFKKNVVWQNTRHGQSAKSKEK